MGALTSRVARAALVAWAITLGSTPQEGWASGFSLRFFGNGSAAPGLDRVEISLDGPHRPVDVGTGDFTIELWLRPEPGTNSAPGCAPGLDNWIFGNIFLDRDVWGGGDWGDYGLSLRGGRVAFGVAQGSSGQGLCATTDLRDGAWHHVAVARRAGDGRMWVWVDGRLEAAGSGPVGDVSYRDGRTTRFPKDPFLVLGAEKHDAGPGFPSFSGWIDELRLSETVRYTGDFTPPAAPFSTDPATAALYHFDEGSGDLVGDSSGAPGGPSHGSRRLGGSPAGPTWSQDTPFGAPRPCAPGPTTTCLQGERFQVEVEWRPPGGETRAARVAFAGSDDSGIFYFLDPDNWEMLVKVLMGCAINDQYWVFLAATTNVEFTVTVTDTATGAFEEYSNPEGQRARAVTDTQAFPTCP